MPRRDRTPPPPQPDERPWLQGLTDAQRDAVMHDSGPLAVLAGPGTGKTFLIVRRIARLIDSGVEPERIVGVTFTVKAAGQLRDKLAELLGRKGADPAGVILAQRTNVHTFHGLALRLIARFPDAAGLPGMPEILDGPQQKRMLRDLITRHRVLPEAAGAGREALAEEAETAIELFRNQGVLPEEAEEHARAWTRATKDSPPSDDPAALAERQRRFAEWARVYRLLSEEAHAAGLCAFGDLITLACRVMLRDRAGVAAIVRSDYRHYVIDEFQDVNAAQVRLVSLLCPPQSNPDVCVVGDDDQAIYGFRGSDDRAFFKFDRLYGSPRRVALEDNYRSAAPVLEVAAAVMAREPDRFAPDKTIRAASEIAKDPGALVRYVATEADSGDGAVIAAMIRLARAAEPALPLSEIAVIARSHSHLDQIAAALRLEGLPVDRRERTGWREDEGVRDVLAWAALISDDRDLGSAVRLLMRSPIRAGGDLVARLAGEYKAALGQFKAGIEGSEDPGGVLAFFALRRPDDAALAQARDLHTHLRETTAQLAADEAIFRIIRSTGVSATGVGSAAARTRRVEHLVQLFRIARIKQTRLAPPGDLPALLEYLEDLSEKDDGESPEDRVDTPGQSDAPSDEDRPDAVQLLTAHAAKGLEFDTVIVPRVSPGKGYPSVRERDEPDVPPGFIDRAGDTRAARARLLAEERRLFYVACTRAKRRLTLLSRWTKDGSKSMSFIDELVRAPLAPLPISRRDERDIIAEAGRAGLVPEGRDALERAGVDLATRETLTERVGMEKSRARARAVAALDALDRPGLGPADLAAAHAALAAAGDELAAVAHAAARLEPPAWLAGHADAGMRDRVSGLAKALKEAKAPPSGEPPIIFRAEKPPLRLSYSKLDLYLRCPRCAYVKYVLDVPEGVREVTDLGNLTHQVLQRFFERWRGDDAEGRPLPGVDDLLAMGRAAWNASHGRGDTPRVHERDQLLAQLALLFQRLHDPRANILELEHEIEFPYPRAGHVHTLKAKIDRIDDLGGGRFRLVDYKTGQDWKTLREPKRDDLQMGVYALAMDERYGAGAPVSGSAEYWLLRSGERGVVDLQVIDREKVRAKIDKAIDGMLAGKWPKAERDCRGLCDILDFPDGQAAPEPA